MGRPKTREKAGLAERLISLGHFGLFQQQDDDVVQALWKEPGVPQALAALALDLQENDLARFLAAEILFAQQDGYPAQKDKAALAALYATALKENFTESANTWGMPGISDGLVGQHVVRLGAAVVRAFAPLLDDGTRVQYEGSEESTIGGINAYRVKDLAAALIAAVKRTPFPLERSPSKRDEIIAGLKKRFVEK